MPKEMVIKVDLWASKPGNWEVGGSSWDHVFRIPHAKFLFLFEKFFVLNFLTQTGRIVDDEHH